MFKKRFLSMLVLLVAVVSGAWATPNSIVINGTPQVGDKSISLTYYFDPANVPGLESYAPTLKVKCAADNKWDEMWLSLHEVSSGTTNISLNTLGEFEAGKTYEVCFAYYNGNWVDEVFQSFVLAAPATYTVTLAEGTEDADKWTISPAEGLEGGETVTVKYSGTKKVKSVKAVKKAASVVTDLSTINANYTAQNGETLTGTLASNVQISIADDATVTLNNVTIIGTNDENYGWAGITCVGDATIILSGTNTVKGFYEDYPGIQAAAGNTLTINGTGSLTASSNGYGAGIGGGFGISCGNIEIQGGVITATGGWSGAGIGAGSGIIGAGSGVGTGESICGTITISGGTVTAIGGSYAAGIGSGYAQTNPSTCGAISISGGTVSATAGALAPAAIGKGGVDTGESTCASVTITPGITSLTMTNTNDVTGIVSDFINAEAVYADTNPITYMLPTSVTDPTITGGMDYYGFATSYDDGTKMWTITKK